MGQKIRLVFGHVPFELLNIHVEMPNKQSDVGVCSLGKRPRLETDV